jgi:hypothetical protein
MCDSQLYFLTLARDAMGKARSMPPGRVEKKRRAVARIYHLLAREAGLCSQPSVHREFQKGPRGGELEPRVDHIKLKMGAQHTVALPGVRRSKSSRPFRTIIGIMLVADQRDKTRDL